MPQRLGLGAVVLAFVFSAATQAQNAPAPKRDLTGIWEPVRAIDGIQPPGALNMPADGKPEHELPYTAFGLEMLKKNHPSNGPNQVSRAKKTTPATIAIRTAFRAKTYSNCAPRSLFRAPRNW